MTRPKKNIDEMRYTELIVYCVKKDRRIKILQEWGLIPLKMKCKKCRLMMVLIKKKNCESMHCWKCNKCKSTRSIYEMSFFEECRIDFLKFIKFAYLYFHDDIGPKRAIYELRLSPNSYYYYKKKFEASIIRDVLLNKTKIGGVGIEVQIDESCFNKRKYNNGRYKSPLWVFGGVEVGTNRCFMCEVPDRSKSTLQSIIDLNIEKDSIIVSDMWKSYIGLSDKGYSHYTVNHKQNFINPITKKHTQLIENLWNLAKKKIHHDFGINRNGLQKHLDIFVWRRTFNRTFTFFIKSLKIYFF
ncbi:hypothetical protein DMUE_5580 [Dictyocoela muelleri]|nr:hypothetical protein DMUE_5580 [Dictyocoela muelleri]